MKRFMMFVAIALAGGVVGSGCGKKEEAPPPPSPPAVTESVPAATNQVSASASNDVASAQVSVDNAMALANDKKYEEALTMLEKKAAEVKDNPEAMNVITNAMEQIKGKMTQSAAGGAEALSGGLRK